MNVNKVAVTNGVEILVGLLDNHNPNRIKVAAPDGGDPVVKTGTPLTAAGVVTTGDNAAGILLYDVDTSANPNGTIINMGTIDSTKAQAYSGITYSDAIYEALPAMTFLTDIGVNE